MTLRNLITDIPGLRVGQAGDAKLGSGVTAVVFDAAVVASVDVRGGGPGTRETALLDPAQTVEGIDAIVLSGGSAFGLDAASGVQAWLREQGRGFKMRDALVPIVPAAIMFDLLNGGDKNWGRYPPYRELGYAGGEGRGRRFRARQRRRRDSAPPRRLSKAASARPRRMTRDGITVGALAVVNAVGTRRSATDRISGRRRSSRTANSAAAAGREDHRPPTLRSAPKAAPQENTTIAVIATDAKLSKAQCNRLAVMAQDGFARAIYPVHTPLDGDVVFAAATGAKPLADPFYGWPNSAWSPPMSWPAPSRAASMRRPPCPSPAALPSWKDKFGASSEKPLPPGTAPDRRTALRPPSSRRSCVRSRGRA